MLVAKAQELRCARVTQHLLFLTDIGPFYIKISLLY